jgi:BASS family bile acid:Na+ symporter
MKRKSIYRISLILALVCLVIVLAMVTGGNISKSGPYFIGFFLFLAIAVRGFEPVKGLSYTIWIFTASSPMFYPQYFTSIGGLAEL